MAENAIEIQEKPILFSGAMVRAVIEGRKTQTKVCAKIRVCHMRTKSAGRNETSNTTHHILPRSRNGKSANMNGSGTLSASAVVSYHRSTLQLMPSEKGCAMRAGEIRSLLTMGQSAPAVEKGKSYFSNSIILKVMAVIIGGKLEGRQKLYCRGLSRTTSRQNSKSFAPTAIREKREQEEYARIG